MADTIRPNSERRFGEENNPARWSRFTPLNPIRTCSITYLFSARMHSRRRVCRTVVSPASNSILDSGPPFGENHGLRMCVPDMRSHGKRRNHHRDAEQRHVDGVGGRVPDHRPVLGGGGAGGGAQRNGGSGLAAGGGGGGANASSTLGVTPGDSYTVAVGTGGTGVSTGNGNPGTDSSFAGHAGGVVAKGGSYG